MKSKSASNQEKIKNHFLKIIAEELAMNDANGAVPPEKQNKEEEKEAPAPIHQEKGRNIEKIKSIIIEAQSPTGKSIANLKEISFESEVLEKSNHEK